MNTTLHTDLKDIPGVDSRYKACADGRIWSGVRGSGKWLAPGLSVKGDYHSVSVLTDDNRRLTKNVHQLVCLAFRGTRPSDKHVVSHLNGNGLDNRESNLVWETQADNLARKKLHGTSDAGTNNTRASMTPETLLDVRERLAAGEKHQSIADTYGVVRTVITRISSGARYGNE